MRRLLPLALLVPILMAPGPRRPRGPNDGRPDALLSVLPAGAGYDSTAGSLRGSFGEALTFARASAWGCANDDESSWRSLLSNKICYRKGGVAVRAATTNVVLRSEEFDNATWLKQVSGVAAPTVTANSSDVVAPDGTQTAEKIEYPAVTGAQYWRLINQFTGSAVPYSGSIWLRTATGTATVYIGFDLSGSTFLMEGKTVTTSWQRFKVENKTLTASGNWFFQLGVDLSDATTPQLAQGAGTIYAWGAMGGLGAFAPDYCGPTAGSTVTCAAETLTAATSTWPTSVAGSVSFDYQPTGATPGFQMFLLDWRTGNSGVAFTREIGNTMICQVGNGTDYVSITSGVLSWTAGQRYRLRLKWDGAGLQCWRDDVSLGTGASRIPNAWPAAAFIGSYLGSTNQASGVISDLILRRE